MTATIDASPAESPTTFAGRRPLRRPIVAAIVTASVIVVLLIGGLIAWHVAAAAATSGVVVLTDDKALTCSPSAAATLAPAEVGSDPDTTLRVPHITLNGPLHCRLSYVIENMSATTVSIDGLDFPIATGIANVRTGRFGGVDDLPSGGASRVYVDLTWTSGCIYKGATDTNDAGPTFRVLAYGLHDTVTMPGPSIAVLGTSVSQADCHF